MELPHCPACGEPVLATAGRGVLRVGCISADCWHFMASCMHPEACNASIRECGLANLELSETAEAFRQVMLRMTVERIQHAIAEGDQVNVLRGVRTLVRTGALEERTPYSMEGYLLPDERLQDILYTAEWINEWVEANRPGSDADEWLLP